MAGEAAGSCVVVVGGASYRNMLSLNLRCSRQEGTCSGTVVFSWPGVTQGVMGALLPGVPGQIILDGQLAATVIFDTRVSKGAPKSYELTLQFRGKGSLGVDSSPDHDTGQFNKQTPDQIIQKILPPGLSMINKGGGGNPLERFIIAEGETVERAARRAAREHSMMLFENPQGQWVLTKMGQTDGGGGELRVGRDFTQWSVKQDASPRFTKLQMFGNMIPTDEKYGKQAESLFANMSNSFFGGGGQGRLLRVGIDSDHDKGSLQDRGDFESNRRGQQSVHATLRMSTWTYRGTGALWKVNQRWHVVIPVDGVDDDLEIDEIEFELTRDTRAATLTLVGDGGGGGGADSIFRNVIEHIAPEPPPEEVYTPEPQPPSERPEEVE